MSEQFTRHFFQRYSATPGNSSKGIYASVVYGNDQWEIGAGESGAWQALNNITQGRVDIVECPEARCFVTIEVPQVGDSIPNLPEFISQADLEALEEKPRIEVVRVYKGSIEKVLIKQLMIYMGQDNCDVITSIGVRSLITQFADEYCQQMNSNAATRENFVSSMEEVGVVRALIQAKLIELRAQAH